MHQTEKLVGETLRNRREAALMTQADLASAIRAKGTKWSQATVWSIERGDRALRLTEAILVAEVIGFHPSIFFDHEKSVPDLQPGIALAIRELQDLLKDVQR